jgi:MFS family permease
MIGICVMSFATILFAGAAYVKDKWTFYGISFFGRMVQGVADSLICVAIPSLVAIEFPNKNEKY